MKWTKCKKDLPNTNPIRLVDVRNKKGKKGLGCFWYGVGWITDIDGKIVKWKESNIIYNT